jgi:photosystem II stability/assembly factor-like uncharacterized protein
MFFHRSIFTLFFFLLISNSLFSQVSEWAWLNPYPIGSNLNDGIIFPDNKKLVFSDGGGIVYFSADGWTVQTIYPDSLSGNRSIYEADFISPDTGYICGISGLLMKTVDGGMTWTHLPSPLTSNYWYLDFINADTGYVVSSDSKIIKTTDGGQTWNIIVLSATATTLYKIYFVSPSTGYLGTGSSTLGRLLKTTDYGATWLPVSSFTSTGVVRGIYFTDEHTGYIGTSLYEIIKTTDAGSTWVTQDLGTGTIYEIKFFDPNNGAAAGASGTVYVTTNAGATWDSTSIGQTTNCNVYGIALGNSYAKDAASIFAVTQSGVIAHSTNMGQQWTQLSRAVTLHNLRSIQMVNSQTGFACGGSTTQSALLKSVDGGFTWERLNFDAGYTLYSQSWINENTGYVARRGPDGIFKTTNGGTSFSQLNPGQASSTQIWYDIVFNGVDTGYACSSGGHIVKTTDGGTSWSLLPDLHSTSAIYALNILDAQSVFAAGSSGKVSKTTDGGATFTAINLTGTTTLYAVAFIDRDNGLVAGVSGKVFRTTDGGLTWTEFNVGANATLYDILYVNSSLIWISGDAGMFYSLDGGVTWTRANKFHGQNIQYSMTIADEFLITAGEFGNILASFWDPVPVELTLFTAAVSGNDVVLNWTTATETNNSGFEIQRSTDQKNWEVLGFVSGNGTISETRKYSFTDKSVPNRINYYRLKQIDYNGSYEYSSVISADVSRIFTYSLEQNYPNPFNPSTIINYSVPVQGAVKIILFDALGREIKVLVDEQKSPGNYHTEFSASGLSSGVYFYQMKAGTFIETRKMLLLQ